jgi:hypothetical protein
VGWLRDLYLIEYLRPTDLRFRLDTSTVKRPGRVSGLWRRYGAICIEAIYPNGIGGSSSNLTIPPLLVVPAGTAVREIALAK